MGARALTTPGRENCWCEMAGNSGGTTAPPVPYGRMARRLELLEAAFEVIRREGPTASMDEIAAQAGITKPIVYRYFGDRAGLYQAVAERYRVGEVIANVIRQRVENVGRDPEPAGPWGHAIGGIMQAASTWWLVHPEVPRARLVDHVCTLLWAGLL